MKKKLFTLMLTIAVMCTALSGCGTGKAQKNASGSTPLVLNEVAHSIFYAPMYAAIENGYFAEEGIDLTLVTGYGADKTMTALLSGEADIGFMGPEGAAGKVPTF